MTSLTTDDLFSVRGKVVLVTGGSRGIGEMIAAGFLANGAKVYISSRKADVCDATAARLAETYGGECISIPADLSDLDGIDAPRRASSPSASRASTCWSTTPAPRGARPSTSSPRRAGTRSWTPTSRASSSSPSGCCRCSRPAATADDPSRVINIGSVDGIRTPTFDTVSYGPSKAAVHTLTSQLAAKLVKRNILVNAIAPGPFPTWMLSTGVGTGGDVEGTDWDALGRTMPRGRIGTPEDIAGLAIFLASRAGAFTVGAVITCDGGIVVS